MVLVSSYIQENTELLHFDKFLKESLPHTEEVLKNDTTYLIKSTPYSKKKSASYSLGKNDVKIFGKSKTSYTKITLGIK